jgi:hypothetical protein
MVPDVRDPRVRLRRYLAPTQSLRHPAALHHPKDIECDREADQERVLQLLRRLRVAAGGHQQVGAGEPHGGSRGASGSAGRQQGEDGDR